jgi:hypothetical protein
MMSMKLIELPHGPRLNAALSDEDRAAQRKEYEHHLNIGLDQWNRALREGFVRVAQYDTSDEGRAVVVFVLHRRRASKTKMMTPRMKAAQAAATLDVAFATLVQTQVKRKAARVSVQNEGSNEALAAEMLAEHETVKAYARVIRAARKLLSATNDLLDQTL